MEVISSYFAKNFVGLLAYKDTFVILEIIKS